MADYKSFDVNRRGDGAISYNIRVDTSRFHEQLEKAQFQLDTVIMADMKPYMPMVKGTFVNTTSAMSAALAGSGQVVAAAPPMGRFLYEGKGMVDELTGSPWARAAAKKVLVSQYAGKTNAKEDLTFRRGQAHWFDAAKDAHGKEWVRLVQDIGGGGK